MEFRKIKVGMQVQVKIGTSKVKCDFWCGDQAYLLKYEGRIGKVVRKDPVDNTFNVMFDTGDLCWFTDKRVEQVIVKDDHDTLASLARERIEIEKTIVTLEHSLETIDENIKSFKDKEYPFTLDEIRNESGVYLSNNGYEIYVNFKSEMFYLGKVGVELELQNVVTECWKHDKFKLTTKTLKLVL